VLGCPQSWSDAACTVGPILTAPGLHWRRKQLREICSPSRRGAKRGDRAASGYRVGFAVASSTRFTTAWGIRSVRAMAAGLIPARNDARMRFSFASEISSTPLVLLLTATGAVLVA